MVFDCCSNTGHQYKVNKFKYSIFDIYLYKIITDLTGQLKILNNRHIYHFINNLSLDILFDPTGYGGQVITKVWLS